MSDSKDPENSTRTGRGRFVKGISGNPGGRPEVEGKARKIAQRAGPRAMRRLIQLMRSPNERVAVAAASAILDRAYGKPAQTISAPNGGALVNINLGSEPIRDAMSAAQVYASILGNPDADLSSIVFEAPARSPLVIEQAAPIVLMAIADEVPMRDGIPIDPRVEPLPNNSLAIWEKL